MQKDAHEFQATATKDMETDRQEMLRRKAMVRPPAPGPSHQEQPQPTLRLPSPPPNFVSSTRRSPPYPTQGYGVPSHPQPTHIQGHPAPPQATQPTRSSGTTDLLPDGDEMFQDFIPPQFAVPSTSIGKECWNISILDIKSESELIRFWFISLEAHGKVC